MKIVWKYLLNQLISLDCALNAVMGGSPYEPISSRLGRNWDGSWAERAVNKIFFWQRDHCSEAVKPPSHWEEDAILAKEKKEKDSELS